MDLYITRKKNIGTVNEQREERYYARKFWELLDCSFVREYSSSTDCYVCAPIHSIDEVNELIDMAVHNRDYFGTYKSIPELCEIRDELEEAMEEGWTYYLEADW